jgi:hypothetical protein
MASTKDLAGLAALGALGYMMSQKGDKADASQSSGDSNPDRGAGYNSTETRLNTPSQSITAADQSSKGSISTRGDSGVTTPGPASAPNLDYKSAAPVSQKTPAAPTAKTNPVKPQAATPQTSISSKSSASPPVDMAPTKANALKYSGTSTDSARTSDALKVNSLKNKQANPTGPRNPRTGRPMTTFDSGSGLNAMDMANMPQAYKKGGAIKKMAKGGLTSSPSSASSRGDGIASRGKTRGKIC